MKKRWARVRSRRNSWVETCIIVHCRHRFRLAPAAKKNLYYRDMPPDLLDELWDRFRSALDPLRNSGKLGVVLFQFAPWFVYRPSSLDLIAACAERMLGDRIAVEFRNKSWFAQKHLAEAIALTAIGTMPKGMRSPY